IESPLLRFDRILDGYFDSGHLRERLDEQGVVVLFDPVIKKLARNLEQQLLLLKLYRLDRDEPGSVRVIRETPLHDCERIGPDLLGDLSRSRDAWNLAGGVVSGSKGINKLHSSVNL